MFIIAGAVGFAAGVAIFYLALGIGLGELLGRAFSLFGRR